jgi:hypothetical protein
VERPETECNVFSGVLRSSTFLGDQLAYCVEVRGQSILGKGRAIAMKTGSGIGLRVDPSDVMVYPADQKIGLSVLDQGARADATLRG